MHVLRGLAGFSWLDESSGWFWLKDNSRNRLLTPIRKILAVADRIELASLREGVGRHYLMQGFAPPRRVLLELCRQLPGFRVENTFIIADPPIDWQEELEAVERMMTRILKENGSVMKAGVAATTPASAARQPWCRPGSDHTDRPRRH